MITKEMVDEFNLARENLKQAQGRLLDAEEKIALQLQEGEMRTLGVRVPAITKQDGHIIYGSIAPLIDETNENESGIRSEQSASAEPQPFAASIAARDPSTYTVT